MHCRIRRASNIKGIPSRLVGSRRRCMRRRVQRSSSPVSSSKTRILIKNGDIVVVENIKRNTTHTNVKDNRRTTSQNAAAIPRAFVKRDAKARVRVVLESLCPRKNTISRRTALHNGHTEGIVEYPRRIVHVDVKNTSAPSKEGNTIRTHVLVWPVVSGLRRRD